MLQIEVRMDGESIILHVSDFFTKFLCLPAFSNTTVEQ